MLSFKEFLAEAKFNPGAIDKVINLLHSLFERKLQTKLYRYGGSKGYLEANYKGKKAKEFLFFKQGGSALAFIEDKGNIAEIRLWKSWTLNGKPSFCIDVDGFNIVQMVNLIIDAVKNPKPGNVPIYFLPESKYAQGQYDFLTEAKRSTPQEFYQLALNSFPPNTDFSKLEWDDIDAIARAHDVQVPGYVRSTRNKGKFSVIPPMEGSKEEAKAEKEKPEVIRYLKITAQGPDGHFLPGKDDKEAQDLYREIQDKVLNPKFQKKDLMDQKTLFGNLASLVKIAATSPAGRSLLIFGGAGIGKSETVKITLKQSGFTENKDFFIFKGRVTSSSLYQTLYMLRDEKIAVFDDCDEVLKDGNAINLLKAALDSGKTRSISWVTNRTQNVTNMSPEERKNYEMRVDEYLKNGAIMDDDDDEEDGRSKKKKDKKLKIPAQFDYNGRIIFISNLPAEKMDSAIMSRGAKIDMTLTQEQMRERIMDLVYLVDIGVHVANEDREMIADKLILADRAGKISSLNVRTFYHALNIYASGNPDWLNIINYM